MIESFEVVKAAPNFRQQGKLCKKLILAASVELRDAHNSKQITYKPAEGAFTQPDLLQLLILTDRDCQMKILHVS